VHGKSDSEINVHGHSKIPLSLPLPLHLTQVLGMLLHSKAHLINSHILHLTYTLVGTVDSERSATISNPIAFRDLLASKAIHIL
jgi:hypothetical protein